MSGVSRLRDFVPPPKSGESACRQAGPPCREHSQNEATEQEQNTTQKIRYAVLDSVFIIDTDAALVEAAARRDQLRMRDKANRFERTPKDKKPRPRRFIAL